MKCKTVIYWPTVSAGAQELEIDVEKVAAGIESFIRKSTENLEEEGIILDLRGIGSAVTAALH